MHIFAYFRYKGVVVDEEFDLTYFNFENGLRLTSFEQRRFLIFQ
jgi:hypothetical protein